MGLTGNKELYRARNGTERKLRRCKRQVKCQGLLSFARFILAISAASKAPCFGCWLALAWCCHGIKKKLLNQDYPRCGYCTSGNSGEICWQQTSAIYQAFFLSSFCLLLPWQLLGRYGVSSCPMAASSGFQSSSGHAASGNTVCIAPAHRRGHQNGWRMRCICSLPPPFLFAVIVA